MGKIKSTQPTVSTKQPKTVSLATFIQALIITALVVGISGIVGGWFIHSNMYSQAKADTAKDFASVLKASR